MQPPLCWDDRAEAASVADFLDRYYKPDRYRGRGEEYAAGLLASHQQDFAKHGYDLISRHDSVTGQAVAYFGAVIPVRSRAAITNALKAGARVRVLAHWKEYQVNTVRIPTKIQTNGYWCDCPDADGTMVRMFSDLPPASELRFNDDGSVTYHPDKKISWTVQFEEHEEYTETTHATPPTS